MFFVARERTINRKDGKPSDLRRRARECGFYIACDDRSILNCVNAMLLNHGLIGLSDTDGKVHYLIDGRRGGNYVMQQVKENVLMLRETAQKNVEYEEVLVRQAIDSVLARYSFPLTLVGSQLVKESLVLLYDEPHLIKSVSKQLYVMVGERFQMSPQQVERNIRYSVKKSRPIPGVTGLQSLLRFLREEVVEEVVNRYGRPY